MPGSLPYTVYTIVYKGEPLDFQQYRHTALYFVPVVPEEGCDGAETYYCNAVGFCRNFDFVERANFNPRTEENFVAQLKIGTTKEPLTAKELVDLMRATPVNNDDYEFNCQTWVQLATERLHQAGYLTQEEYDNGVTDMILETMKAEDEPIPFATGQ